MTNWHHFACFVKRGGKKPTSAADISQFNDISPADQDKIAEKFFGGVISFEPKPIHDGPEMLVDYAKSNRSSCRGCAGATTFFDSLLLVNVLFLHFFVS
jgi:hypothetical protein